MSRKVKLVLLGRLKRNYLDPELKEALLRFSGSGDVGLREWKEVHYIRHGAYERIQFRILSVDFHRPLLRRA